MSEPNPAPGLFERVAPAIARMSREPVLASDEDAAATVVAYRRLAQHYANAGLIGLARFYEARADELDCC